MSWPLSPAHDFRLLTAFETAGLSAAPRLSISMPSAIRLARGSIALLSQLAMPGQLLHRSSWQ